MKKTMSIILALVMCLSMAATAFASQIQPRNPSCDACGGDTIHDYRLEKNESCGCGNSKCQVYYWIYECTSCGEYYDIGLMGCTCTNCSFCE